MFIASRFEQLLDFTISQYASMSSSLLGLSTSDPAEPSRFFRGFAKFIVLNSIPAAALAFPTLRTIGTIALIAYASFKIRNMLFYLGAARGNLTLVKATLLLGSDVNGISLERWTALHYAVDGEGFAQFPLTATPEKSRIEIVKLLLQNGADPNLEAQMIKSGFDFPHTPMNWVISKGSLELFQSIEASLLQKGTQIDYQMLLDIAQDADTKKNEAMIQILKDKIGSVSL